MNRALCCQPISLYYPNSPCKKGVLYRGWREYHVSAKPGCLRPLPLYYPHSPCKKGGLYHSWREYHVFGKLGWRLVPRFTIGGNATQDSFFINPATGEVRVVNSRVQFHPTESQLDVVWLTARTPHGGASYVW